jgi:hypothetical protein
MAGHQRKRLKIALLGIVCLLLQQVALAAYLCPIDGGRVAMSTMTAGCPQMNEAHVAQAPGLCVAHCHPEHPSAADAAKLYVPPLALPPVVFPDTTVQAAPRAGLRADVSIARSDPPPRLQFCSLLI